MKNYLVDRTRSKGSDVRSVAAKFGISPEVLRFWCGKRKSLKQDAGRKKQLKSEERKLYVRDNDRLQQGTKNSGKIFKHPN